MMNIYLSSTHCNYTSFRWVFRVEKVEINGKKILDYINIKWRFHENQ